MCTLYIAAWDAHRSHSEKTCFLTQLLEDGANEIDMVINLGMVKNQEYSQVTEEIRLLKEATGDKILKVIIENCYLTEEEKIRMCEAVTEAGADFIKTSTGFGTGGATLQLHCLYRSGCILHRYTVPYLLWNGYRLPL